MLGMIMKTTAQRPRSEMKSFLGHTAVVIRV